MKPIVIDCHYLCHRAFHTTRALSWKGQATGVIYGFPSALHPLMERFKSDRFVFCFEGAGSLRKKIRADYKGNRPEPKTREEEKARAELRLQIDRLKGILRKIGFNNVFYFEGLESDDIMAKIALTLPCVLVTADSDLYQCLRPEVEIFSPQKNKTLTSRWFIKTYKLGPQAWVDVKAIAGCKSDNVRGICGIGEKTAIRFLRGLLPAKKHNRIVDQWRIVEGNYPLVRLPFRNTPMPPFQEDGVTLGSWGDACRELGMKSLLSYPPIL